MQNGIWKEKVDIADQTYNSRIYRKYVNHNKIKGVDQRECGSKRQWPFSQKLSLPHTCIYLSATLPRVRIEFHHKFIYLLLLIQKYVSKGYLKELPYFKIFILIGIFFLCVKRTAGACGRVWNYIKITRISL